MHGIIILAYFTFAHAAGAGFTNYATSASHHGFGRFRNRGTPKSAATTSSPPVIAAGINSGLGFDSDTSATELYNQPVENQSEFNKEFFTYSAPEEDFNDIDAAQRLTSAMRKNLRVVFIRAPENNAITNAALELAKQSSESKTSIFVLSKQTDYTELANKLQSVQQGITEKPEVHFVKYRTPEDAVRAQQIIQNEYNNLGGTSRVSNEAVAPVLDFASQPSQLATQQRNLGDSGATSAGSGHEIASHSNGYLAQKFRS